MNPYSGQFNGPSNPDWNRFQTWDYVKGQPGAPAQSAPQYTYAQPIQYPYTQPREYGQRPCRKGYRGYRNHCYPKFPQTQASGGKRKSGFGDFLKNLFKGAAFGAVAGGAFGLISSLFRR